MEELNKELPSYWKSVGLAAAVVAIVSFVFELGLQYMQISSEASMGMLVISALGGFAVCLFTALGGMAAIWHYAKTFDITLELGKGALIGFLTGAGIVIISILLEQVWSTIDPDLSKQMAESMIATFENMEMPEDMKQMLIDSAAAESDGPSVGGQLLSGILVTGLLNLLSGMLGISLFARQK